MGENVKQDASGTLTLTEIREFANFSSKSQRYIRMALDVAFGREDAVALWSRNNDEIKAMKLQQKKYANLDTLRSRIPSGNDIAGNEIFFAQLMAISSFDILQGKLDCFAAYRFLYERLLGANVRPWLPAIFCATASLPQLDPKERKKLLQSISEAAATAVGWSKRSPSFFPEWVEKVENEF